MLTRFVRDDGAQDLVEYAFLAAFFGIVGWFVLSTIGPTVRVTYESWQRTDVGMPSLWEPYPPWNSSGT